MRFQAGIQILLLVIAVVIVFTVIKPKFDEISYMQNEAVTYQTALDNIGRYNQRLQALINQANSMSTMERTELYRYLPEEIDALAVGRDIANIVENNDLLLMEIEPQTVAAITTSLPEGEVTATEAVAPVEPTEINPMSTTDDSSISSGSVGMMEQKFKISVVGRYEQMKAMLADLERNAYPLRLVEFEFNVDEEGSPLMEYAFTVATYSLGSKMQSTN